VTTDDERRRLRAAAYTADGKGIVGMLAENGLPDDALQLAGDGLLAALDQRVENAPVLARRLAAALRGRAWPGDVTLADQLEAAVGTGPQPLLRSLPVDLDELADVLEGDLTQGDGHIDLSTGEVWTSSALEYAIEAENEDSDPFDDPSRWLFVECRGSRLGYQDMEWFIATLEDANRAERLGIAIEGRGAFRRFKDVLSRWPGEMDRWLAFSDERKRGRAREWLAAAGYRVAPRRQRP
jgi:hypothetical protein